MRSSLSPFRRVAAAAFILALAVAACSSSKHKAGAPSSSAPPASTSPAPASPSVSPSGSMSPSMGGSSSFAPSPGSPEATIQKNWQTFFDGKTSADQKVALLQNGAQFQQVIYPGLIFGGVGQVFAYVVERARKSGDLQAYYTTGAKPNDNAARVVSLTHYRWLFTSTPLRLSHAWRDFVAADLFDRAVARKLEPGDRITASVR